MTNNQIETAGASGGKISENLKDLRNLKKAVEALQEAILMPRNATVIAQARSIANKALEGKAKGRARTDAMALLRNCDQLEADRNKACAGLRTLISGLDKAVDGYSLLESELADMKI